MAQTIRDLIQSEAKRLRDNDDPHEVAEILKNLSSLLASINKECADRKYWLGLKRLELLKEHFTASKANIYTEATQEFKDWLECEEYRKATIEMIRGAKYFLRNSEQEFREGKY